MSSKFIQISFRCIFASLAKIEHALAKHSWAAGLQFLANTVSLAQNAFGNINTWVNNAISYKLIGREVAVLLVIDGIFSGKFFRASSHQTFILEFMRSLLGFTQFKVDHIGLGFKSDKDSQTETSSQSPISRILQLLQATLFTEFGTRGSSLTVDCDTLGSGNKHIVIAFQGDTSNLSTLANTFEFELGSARTMVEVVEDTSSIELGPLASNNHEWITTSTDSYNTAQRSAGSSSLASGRRESGATSVPLGALSNTSSLGNISTNAAPASDTSSPGRATSTAISSALSANLLDSPSLAIGLSVVTNSLPYTVVGLAIVSMSSTLARRSNNWLAAVFLILAAGDRANNVPLLAFTTLTLVSQANTSARSLGGTNTLVVLANTSNVEGITLANTGNASTLLEMLGNLDFLVLNTLVLIGSAVTNGTDNKLATFLAKLSALAGSDIDVLGTLGEGFDASLSNVESPAGANTLGSGANLSDTVHSLGAISSSDLGNMILLASGSNSTTRGPLDTFAERSTDNLVQFLAADVELSTFSTLEGALEYTTTTFLEDTLALFHKVASLSEFADLARVSATTSDNLATSNSRDNSAPGTASQTSSIGNTLLGNNLSTPTSTSLLLLGVISPDSTLVANNLADIFGAFSGTSLANAVLDIDGFLAHALSLGTSLTSRSSISLALAVGNELGASLGLSGNETLANLGLSGTNNLGNEFGFLDPLAASLTVFGAIRGNLVCELVANILVALAHSWCTTPFGANSLGFSPFGASLFLGDLEFAASLGEFATLESSLINISGTSLASGLARTIYQLDNGFLPNTHLGTRGLVHKVPSRASTSTTNANTDLFGTITSASTDRAVFTTSTGRVVSPLSTTTLLAGTSRGALSGANLTTSKTPTNRCRTSDHDRSGKGNRTRSRSPNGTRRTPGSGRLQRV